MYVAGTLSIKRLTTFTTDKTGHVPVIADCRQIMAVAYRQHTAGTRPSPDLAVLAQPEVVICTSGV